MKQTDITKHFVFSNQADDLYPLLLKIMDFVKGAVAVDETANFKLKIILTELLTNAIKHSHCLDTFIDITIAGSEISIIKSDLGDALVLEIEGVKREWPLPGRHIENQSVKVYGDDHHSLVAKLKNNCSLSFYVEEHLSSALTVGDISNLSEHFGLMIIAKAADRFDYEYDIDNSSNKFVITIFLANL